MIFTKYHPLSLLPFPAKYILKIVHKHFLHLNPSQSSFCPYYSTETGLPRSPVTSILLNAKVSAQHDFICQQSLVQLVIFSLVTGLFSQSPLHVLPLSSDLLVSKCSRAHLLALFSSPSIPTPLMPTIRLMAPQSPAWTFLFNSTLLDPTDYIPTWILKK